MVHFTQGLVLPLGACTCTMPPSNRQRHRAYCFTINNPTSVDEDLLLKINDLKPVLLIYALEYGDEATPHYQGYVRFGLGVDFSR